MNPRMDASEHIDPHGFDNHRAKQYFADFLEDPTLDFIEDTFEYDADDLGEATEALFAAELVAGLIGAPAAQLPDAVKAALKGKPTPNKKLLNKTRMAVRSILDEKSALRTHWQENGIEPWLGAVKNLLDRLT
jgi:hypothetical protein